MDVSTRAYYVGVNLERERLTIVVNRNLRGIPFNVWRDVARLAGCSISTPDTEVFEFLTGDPNAVERAERILQGALFKRQ